MIPEALAHAIRVTALVAMMMIAVEYLNVLTRGVWVRALGASRARQYLVAALLGATPGCLGAFAVVALYTHRMVSFGALVACMIATSGDEAFVMLALFPGTALLLTLGLAMLGGAVGVACDRLVGDGIGEARHDFELHEDEGCECLPWGRLLAQLRRPSAARGVLALGGVLFVLGVLEGQLGPPEWNWMRWTLLLVGSFGLFIVLTVPEHFLEEHLWRHTVLQHVPRVFAWTAAALLAIALGQRWWPAGEVAATTRWLGLVVASLLGLVPESGPHLLFVTLYSKGLVPLSTLVASSIVQDGHGMLPLLAHSRSDFLKVKGVNLVVGLAVGGLLMLLGW